MTVFVWDVETPAAVAQVALTSCAQEVKASVGRIPLIRVSFNIPAVIRAPLGMVTLATTTSCPLLGTVEVVEVLARVK